MVATVASEDCEPLRQSEAMAELSKKLGLLERVRHVCQAVQIPLPGVVVVGEQSAGKSSLLENISGIQFPRAQNTCTRMPCVLTMLTDPSATEPHAFVSMHSNFSSAERCPVSAVGERIRAITEEHTKEECFISRRPLYIRVVRSEGPQLSLIDLPGVTHNAVQMVNIHEVTASIVEEYIRPEEVVILCVIPATSDFGNAEVIKLARKYDPEGKRTLGVVTKCDDAARVEACDIVDKVMMRRETDVQLKLGFHCVVNRSQKNIDDRMPRSELWEKERSIFETNEQLRGLPREHWGTLRLMEKIAHIQEGRVDECLPKIKESVRIKVGELRDELRALPAQLDTEADQFRLFNSVLRRVIDDLQRRVRAEFVSSKLEDREVTIAPRVASMVQNFRERLHRDSPEWLGQAMLDEVDETLKNYIHGYTVDNLMGPQVFINLIKRIFVEDGLLREAAQDLVDEIAEHLRCVVTHVIELHADLNGVLASRLIEKAHDVIDELLQVARSLCDALAEAQQVTSTTHGGYMVKLSRFRKSWFEQAVDGVKEALGGRLRGPPPAAGPALVEDSELPAEFQDLVRKAQKEPQKLAVLEICASLHVYTSFLLEGFVDMATKLVKFNLVEKLSEKLEERWRADLAGHTLAELFPRDEAVAQRREDLQDKMAKLQSFKDQLASLRMSALPAAVAGPSGALPGRAPRRSTGGSHGPRQSAHAQSPELATMRPFPWSVPYMVLPRGLTDPELGPAAR